MKDKRLYLIHMLECIAAIERYYRPDPSQLRSPGAIQDAILHRLQLIGENVRRIDDAVKNALPDIPWQKIVDFRSVIVHEYMNLDFDRIDAVITQHLMPLYDTCARELKRQGIDYDPLKRI